MRDAFLTRFYSTQRSVGITELTQTEQQMHEKAADFINRWRNLSLHCPQPITESEAVRMCMNNLRPDMAVYLQGVRPITLEELASKATDIENYLSHIARRSKFVDKVTNKKKDRTPEKTKTKQACVVEPRTSGATSDENMRPRETSSQAKEAKAESSQRRNGPEERGFYFPDEEVHDLFKRLRELNLIELPAST